jgi:hypothetical protein
MQMMATMKVGRFQKGVAVGTKESVAGNRHGNKAEADYPEGRAGNRLRGGRLWDF